MIIIIRCNIIISSAARNIRPVMDYLYATTLNRYLQFKTNWLVVDEITIYKSYLVI